MQTALTFYYGHLPIVSNTKQRRIQEFGKGTGANFSNGEGIWPEVLAPSGGGSKQGTLNYLFADIFTIFERK